MTEPILIVGAGPVGLTLALDLARHGVRCRIIDRLVRPLPYCRAIGVTPRTLEVWDDLGLARDMADAGLWLTGLRSIVHGHPTVDADAPDLGLPYAELGLPQYETERLLAERLARAGIRVDRGVTLTALSQDADGVDVSLDGPDGPQQARYAHVVGCDGAHSAVRHLLDIPFEGEAYPWPFMLGDVHIAWDLPYGKALRALRLVPDAPPDMFIAIPLPEPGRYRVSMLAPPALAGAGGSDHGIQSELAGPSLEDLQRIADDLLPGRPRLSDLRWSSIFRISMRLAGRYADRRVFLAGDAAHIHPPTGGQGMNTGIQDAYNLAWKLALVCHGRADAALLDSYDAERRPVGADVVARTSAASQGYGREGKGGPDRMVDAQMRVNYRGSAWVHDTMPDAPEGVPGAGDRAPDAGGLRRAGFGFALRLFDVLRGTRHVLLVHPGAQTAVADAGDTLHGVAAGLGDVLRTVVIRPGEGAPQQAGPDVVELVDDAGSFAAAYGAGPSAWLIRPDGHVGWRGDPADRAGFAAYAGRVFGAAAA